MTELQYCKKRETRVTERKMVMLRVLPLSLPPLEGNFILGRNLMMGGRNLECSEKVL